MDTYTGKKKLHRVYRFCLWTGAIELALSWAYVILLSILLLAAAFKR